MRVKLLVSVLAVFFLFVAGAQAFQWHMSHGQAQHSSKEFAEVACHQDKKCSGYEVGQCLRRTESRFDCEVELFYADQPKPEEEVECNMVLHWGVNHTGVVVLKNYGKPRCSIV
jgi:hypothetical protein